jgi:hypothetical protein
MVRQLSLWPPRNLREKQRGAANSAAAAVPASVADKPDVRSNDVTLPPCVDGSELARTFLNVCSIGRCSHVFGLFTRFT